jgi:hypothetical protein
MTKLHRKWLRTGLAIASCIIAGLGALGILLLIWIDHSVADNTSLAQRQFTGDPVEACIAALSSDGTTIKTKDRMIWTLGTLEDKRALPILKTLYTGEACRHGYAVCQYELEKAVNRTRNPTVSKGLVGGLWLLLLAITAGTWWKLGNGGPPKRQIWKWQDRRWSRSFI